MLTLLVIVKVLVAVAGLALLGQGIVAILAGANRESNVFYRVLRTIGSPVTWLVRRITPRKLVPDQHIAAAAFFLMAGVYIALVIEQAELCLANNLQHFSCERLVVAYQERCAAGLTQACEVIKHAAEAQAGQPK